MSPRYWIVEKGITGSKTARKKRTALFMDLRVSLYSQALIRNNGAVSIWDMSLKMAAFWIVLGVRKSGMKG